MNSPLLEKSLDFATQIVLFYETFSKTRKDTTIAKQLLRSATSVGANIAESKYGHSRADFIAKLEIALKEASETGKWLEMLYKTNYIDEPTYRKISNTCSTIRILLIASIKTAKENNK